MTLRIHAENKPNFWICLFLCSAILFMVFGFLGPAFASDLSVLNLDDCEKCHAYQTQRIATAGGKHATEIGCLDCHPQHPPTAGETVAACSSCHSDRPHLQLEGCLDCHADPHQPLASLRDPVKPAKKECLSCHARIGQQMTASPSRHAKLFCSRCHSRHKEIPGCLDCHQPHLQTQLAADCTKCHPAHQPRKIVPTGYVSAGFCRPCHLRQSRDLAQTNTNHGGINCVYCHKGQHPTVPQCQDCHGLPHAQSIHSQYRSCRECHGDAHSLISNR